MKNCVTIEGKSEFAFQPRIIRSPLSEFYGAEIENSLHAYPDSYLKGMISEGYNAIWFHALLREVVPTKLFPEAGTKKIVCLNRLVEKVSGSGVKVYLYLCEPRGFRAEDSFWEKHPELKGQPTVFENVNEGFDGKYLALCSSTEAVKEFLEESSYNLFKQVPGLGGVFLITASEFHAHCYSHFSIPQKTFVDPYIESMSKIEFVCPRCRSRQPAEVAAEIITLINRGVKAASPRADVIAWTWSWYLLEPDPQEKLIGLLPKDVILMSDLERGGSKNVCGKRYPVDEYSFSYIGPSPRFQKQLKLAKRRGMKTMAKIQINYTHEMASLPYLPLPYLLAEKIKRMKKLQVDGYLGCWNTGLEFSFMSRLVGRLSLRGEISPGKSIRELAGMEFGSASAMAVCRAWRKFSSAWRKYPFSVCFVYLGPLNYAPAYPLFLEPNLEKPPACYHPLPRDAKGHLKFSSNIQVFLKPYDAKTAVKAFRAVSKEWDEGVKILTVAFEKNRDNPVLAKELNLARHIALSIKSIINIIQFYTIFNQYREKRYARNRVSRRLMKKILEEEMQLTARDKELITLDPRLGYHTEALVNLFTPADLDHKIFLMKQALKRIA